MSVEAKHSSHGDVAPLQDLYIDPTKEKKLLRKLDTWIAPIMTIIFLTAYLDRSNIGNAASAGMVQDIGMTDGELGNNYESAKFLNEEERQMMRVRAHINARYNGKPDFDWAEVRKAALDPKLYISCWSQFMADLCSFGLSSFLPLIIKSFGYDTVTTQLLTIPVFFWASFAYIVVSWMSDRWQRRAFFMMPACLVTAIGYAVNLGIPMNEKGILYFSTFLIAPGVYMIVGLNCTWLLNSHAPYYKRAMAIGMNQSIGNSAGVVVS
ncbi:hypothetical protein K4F52_008693 [Lecanicillium sp. MT-2017a]|nr:hypothetical protein K4F52_008693 [Lecanicillium sp. MT-2017a]